MAGELSAPEEMEVAVRAWAVPDYARYSKPVQSGGRGGDKPRRRELGASPWSLTFDTESTRDPSQRLRLGAWQLRQHGRLRQAGIFSDPDALTGAEITTIESFATEHGLAVLTRDEFAEGVFLRVAWDRRGLIVGHNLPFDLARIAIDHRPAQSRDRSMRGAFSFQLSRDVKRSHVQVKHISPGAAFMRVTIPAGISPEKRNQQRGGRTPNHHGYFVDTVTLGGALLGGRPSLKLLGDLLATEHRKLDTDEHGEEITPEYLAYAMRDVQVTWECFEQLRDRYNSYQLSKGPWAIYSEASIGKAHLEKMQLTPVRRLPEGEMPDWLTAALLESYYGGRAECAIRRTPVPGVLVDFTSQYPTVFTLLGLWKYATAERIAWDETDAREIQRLLDHATVDDVLDPEFWPLLRVLVLVAPDGDRLPTRARYRASGRGSQGAGGNGALNVALPFRDGGPAQHWTLADCLASKLHTGKAPRVLRAWRFSAHGTQPHLVPIDVAGDPAYRVDPGEDDFIKRLVELRATVKRHLAQAQNSGDDERYARLDAIQQGMKITANAISYGAAIEMNPIEHRKPVSVTVHHPDGTHHRARVNRSEQPGKWFQPLIATLIASGGRLLLAAGMRLIADHGGHYAFCDTDSLFIAATRHGGLDHARSSSAEHCDGGKIRMLSWEQAAGIVARFEALNPYDPAILPGSILKIEPENYDPGTGEQREIECYAVAAKRYALFRRDATGRPVVISDHKKRRRSEHGLGHLLPPHARRPIDEDPDWLDEWWQHLLNVELGFPSTTPAWFAAIAVGRLTVTSPRDERAFRTYNHGRPYTDRVRPWNFLILAHPTPHERAHRGIRCLLAPFERDHQRRASMNWIDRDQPQHPGQLARTNETPQSIAGTVAVLSYRHYFETYRIHPEAKALDPADGQPCHTWTRGLLQPRPVHGSGLQRVGKESNRLTDTPQPEGTDEDSLIEYPAQRVCHGCDEPVSGRRRWCTESCRKRYERRSSSSSSSSRFGSTSPSPSETES